MIIHRQIKRLQNQLREYKKQGTSIGFVPTMGALHQGHLSLMDASLKLSEVTICSIFVNPTQFNDPADFKKYPLTLQEDLDLLYKKGVQLVFVPEVTEIYPEGEIKKFLYELGELDKRLEGLYRPGHFQGVCQVVHRLLDIVEPNILYLGQKDYQQCLVIQKLLEITGKPVSLHICPTLREASGLAMSSRNSRLSAEHRGKAALIYKCLMGIKSGLKKGEISYLAKQAEKILTDAGFRVDYVEIAEAGTLATVTEWDGYSPLVALAAAFLGEVRLIDNLRLNEL